jgi:hypothetical protein
MGRKPRKIVAEQLLRDPSPSTTLRVRMTKGTCNGKFNRNCYVVRGSETADAILWLFGLSRVRLERKKEWLCDSGESLLWF